jgi:hypothetical protein
MCHTAASNPDRLHKALPNTRFVKLPHGISRVFSFKASQPVSPGQRVVHRVHQSNRAQPVRQPLANQRFSNFLRPPAAANSLKLLRLSEIVKG